jgi:hypothetical protein
MALSWNGDERRGGRRDPLFVGNKMGLDGDGLSDTASSMTVQEPSYVSEDDAYSLMGLCKEINRNAEWSRLNAEKRAYLKQMAQAKAAQFSGMDMVPSGKRQQGEGCEDDDQNIIQASETSDGCVVLRITLLAAGFVIGEFFSCCYWIPHNACRKGDGSHVYILLIICRTWWSVCQGYLRGVCVQNSELDGNGDSLWEHKTGEEACPGWQAEERGARCTHHQSCSSEIQGPL